MYVCTYANAQRVPWVLQTLEAAPEPLEVEEPDFLPFGAGMPGPNVLGPNFGPLPDLHEEGDSEVG